MNTPAPMLSRFKAWLLTTRLFAWAYALGRAESDRDVTAAAYQHGYDDCEQRIPGLLKLAREDAGRIGYRRGQDENARIYTEYCSEHPGCKLVRLRDGLTLTYGLCYNLHKAARDAADASRDTDGVIPRALMPDKSATNYGQAFRAPTRPTIDLSTR